MKSEILSQDRNVLVIKAAVEAEVFAKAVSDAARDLSRKANLKGFRKGHVPRKTLELFFGKEALHQEALERLIPRAVDELVQEYDLVLIQEPQLKLGTVEEGQPLEVEITFEVRPEVTLPEVESLTATRHLHVVDEALVDRQIQRVLEMNATLQPLEEDRVVGAEDIVDLEYSSSVVHEDRLEPLEQEQKSPVELQNPSLRREIAEALTGRSVGDTFELDLPVDAEYRDPRVAGKTVRYAMNVRGLLQRVIPELDDDTAGRLTKDECPSVESFRARVRKDLESAAADHAADSLRASAVQALCDACEVELPESLVQRQVQDLRKEQEERIKRETNLEWSAFLQQSGLDEAQLLKDLEEKARELVKRSLVLETLADREAIQWTPEEMNQEIQSMAKAMGVEADRLKSFVLSNEERFGEIASKLRGRKTVDWLVSKVKVEDVTATEDFAEPQVTPAEEADANA